MRPQTVHRISFGVVNAYLIPGRSGSLLVDTGLPGFSARLVRLLGEVGRVALVVLTHVHFEHVGGLAAVRAATGAPVPAHRSRPGFTTVRSRRRSWPATARTSVRLVFRGGQSIPLVIPPAPSR